MGVAQERNEKHLTCAIAWNQRTVWSTWIQYNIPGIHVNLLIRTAPTTNKVNCLEFRLVFKSTTYRYEYVNFIMLTSCWLAAVVSMRVAYIHICMSPYTYGTCMRLRSYWQTQSTLYFLSTSLVYKKVLWCVVPDMSLWWRSRWKRPLPHKTEGSRPKHIFKCSRSKTKVWKHAWYTHEYLISGAVFDFLYISFQYTSNIARMSTDSLKGFA